MMVADDSLVGRVELLFMYCIYEQLIVALVNG